MAEAVDPTPGAGSGLKVVEKALRVLDLFTHDRPSWTVTEISRELDLPMTTAHRISHTLLAQGYLMRSDRARYRLGLAAIDLGQRASASLNLRTALRPVLKRLAIETGESALLSVYDESRHAALTIDRIEASHALRLSLRIGSLNPLHAGATPKALLANLGDAVIAETLAAPLEPLTPKTITDPAELRAELATIRADGWAASFEETDLGAWGVAAPVLGAGRLIAVIGIAAPTARFSPATRERSVEMVLAAAAAAAATLDRGDRSAGAG